MNASPELQTLHAIVSAARRYRSLSRPSDRPTPNGNISNKRDDIAKSIRRGAARGGGIAQAHVTIVLRTTALAQSRRVKPHSGAPGRHNGRLTRGPPILAITSSIVVTSVPLSVVLRRSLDRTMTSVPGECSSICLARRSRYTFRLSSRDPQIRPQVSRLFASRPADADISGPDKITNTRSYS